MTASYALIGLVEGVPRHGYELKRIYDQTFGAGPIKSGQIYGTLARLQRDQMVRMTSVEVRGGPERKRYMATPRGVEALESWLREPEGAGLYSQKVVFAKVLLCLISGRSATAVIECQREAHLSRMRELTRSKGRGLCETVACDFELFHLEADLRWMDLTRERLDRLRSELVQ